MANQKSLTDLKDQAESVHKNEFGKPLYDYQNVKYAFQNKGIWEIRCDLHSTTFFQNFRKHLSGQTGCKECSAENKRKNSFTERRENFLKNAYSIHQINGQLLYDYSEVNYVSNHIKVDIVCPKADHGVFHMTPANHTHKTNPQHCPKCSGSHVRSKDEFIKEAKKLHTDKEGNALYDYSLINYIDTTKHVSIYCKKHNLTYSQTPAKHLAGQKCRKCSKEIAAVKKTMTTDEFITAAEKVHKDAKGNPKYDYSKVEYKNNYTKVTIICPHHGPFSQSPSVHKDSLSGCPACRASKGEQIIAEFLTEHKIEFEREFKFDDCVNKKPLPFDFKVMFQGKIYLIEYNGEIHYKPVKYSKNDLNSETRFKDIQARDGIKRDYAKKNDIQLTEIAYKSNDDEIHSILKKLFDL